jgi:hypothetical protein
MVFASILAGSVSLSTAAFADTTTTVSTTTVTGYSLPAGGTYVVVDPITGELRGAYDPTTRLLNGQPLPVGYFITDKITGRVVATVDTSGNIVDITSAPATTVLISSIDARRAALAQMITDALTKGYLTADQAAPLRVELDRLNGLYVAANADGTMTLTEAFPIAYGLNNLTARIVPLAHTTTVITPLVGQRFLLENNVIVYADDTAFRRIQLERRIDDEYAAGRLSSKQVSELKKQINDIAYMETRYTHRGEISSSNRKRIEKKFDEVKIDLDKDVAYINSRRSKIGIRVD